MSHPIVTTVAIVAAVANGISLSQSLPGTSGLSLLLNGTKVTAGVAILDAPRRIAIASNGNDAAITFSVTGTRGSWWAQQTITEVVTGTNVGTATTVNDFLTVTSIVASAATASTVTAGTNGTASGPWCVWSRFADDFQVTLEAVVVSGAPTYGVEYTYDDVFGLWLPTTVTYPRPIALSTMTNLTTAIGTVIDGSLLSGCMASRLTLTAVGSVQLTSQQQGA